MIQWAQLQGKQPDAREVLLDTLLRGGRVEVSYDGMEWRTPTVEELSEVLQEPIALASYERFRVQNMGTIKLTKVVWELVQHTLWQVDKHCDLGTAEQQFIPDQAALDALRNRYDCPGVTPKPRERKDL